MKKFKLAITLALCFGLCICGCKKTDTTGESDSNTQTEETTETTEEETSEGFIAIQPIITKNTCSKTKDDGVEFLVESSYDTISLDEESAQYYSALDSALNSLSDTMLASQKDNFESNVEYATTDYEEGYLDDGMYYNDDSSLSVERADESVFSISQSTDTFTGGAHGSYGTTGYTFDTQTGKQLELSDIFTSVDDIIPVLKNSLETNYPDVEFFDLDQTLQSYIDDPDTYQFSWYMNAKGVMFIFNPYELASYAEGSQNVLISFAEHEELFTGDYTAATGAYVLNLYSGNDYYIDLNGDNTQEHLSITENYEDSMCSSATIVYDDASYDLEAYFYTTDIKAIHTKDDKIYLFIFLHGDNDFTSLDVVSLNDGKIQKVGGLNVAEPSLYVESEDEEDGIWQYYPLVSPTGFILSSHLDAISTYDGIKTYTLDSDGMPVSDSDYYFIRNGRTLTVKKDFQGFEVDINTNELKKESTISAGEKLTFYRTNGTDTVIFEKEDGTFVGVQFEIDDDLGRTINGISEEDLLDGIMYAG
ncbi:MAG: RsiV family protein [Lachnospiraceae bacterium]|nr:RsiV family protein [Lachnospiraceae bacterium]